MATILGLFGVTSWQEAGRMTVSEYHLRMKGYALRRLEDEKDIYLQAFLNRVAKATDKAGKKYQFPTFSDFYGYEKRRREILGIKKEQVFDSDLLERTRRVRELREKGVLDV